MLTAMRNALRHGPWAGFAKATSGLAALEFALILPIMVLLYLGGFEVTEAFMINRKVTHATSALGDLVAQAEDISDTDMSNIFDAVEAVLNPYPADDGYMIVSGVSIDADGVATVVWSDARFTSAYAVGTEISLPLSVTQNNTFVVFAEVHYEYTPQFGYTLTGVIDLQDQFYLRPRLQNQVYRT